MPLIRGHHSFDDNYTQIPNAWVRDERLSYKARGVLVELMSHRPGWSVSVASMSERGKDGKDAIKSAIRELEAVGYLQREQTRTDGNRFGETNWVTREPLTGFPLTEIPTTDNPTPKKTITKEEPVKEVNPRPVVEGLFEEFYKLYPRKREPIAAKKAFLKAYDIYGEDVMRGVRRLANDPNLPPKQYIPYPASWLNAGGWADEPYPARERTKDEIEAEARLKAAEARERELRRSEALRAEMAEAKERATAAPDCEHGLPLWRCTPCCLRLAEQEVQGK